MAIKLDYTIESPEKRKALVEQIIAETPDITPAYLEVLANYLIFCMEKQERKKKKILTENRMITVNKRECSYEGLATEFENGEDGIYSIISEDKNIIFKPKVSITQQDLESIPCLKQLRETINNWEKAFKKASGKEAYIIKKAIIEMRQDQYLIKQAYQRPIVLSKITRSSKAFLPLEDKSYMKNDRDVIIDGISLMDQKVVSAILCNYSKLKEDSYDQFNGDTWYLIETFDTICDKALKDFPIYEKIVEMKIDGKQNNDIQLALKQQFGSTYAIEYISSLWRRKIPKVIATAAKENFIIWWYNTNKLPRKKCSRCGQLKPAHNQFFSRNKTSRDGWYSICKHCRNKKKG